MLKISINKVLLDRWPKQHEHEVILSSVSKCCADVLTALNQLTMRIQNTVWYELFCK